VRKLFAYRFCGSETDVTDCEWYLMTQSGVSGGS